jgi:parallel beta-helix repeat protein
MDKIKQLLICLLFVSGTAHCLAQTTIPGGIVSGNWPLSGSPYKIMGAIQIPNDSTLTIQPGVTVIFQGNYKLYVLGRILAIGTATDTITFTAANTTTGWRSIRFISPSGNNDTSRITYCKLQYGNASGPSPDDQGGALYFTNFSKAVISHNSILNCKANLSGGAIYCESSSNPVIINNTISNNKSGVNTGGSLADGGGIYCTNSSPVIGNNLISYNIAGGNSGNGGGISCESNSSPVITYNTISNNSSNNGGGINSSASSPTISNNVISGNMSPGGWGGGISCYDGTYLILNNVISNNTTSDGGGICGDNGTYTITGNDISNNTVVNDGGGICCYGGSYAIAGNNISNNSANAGGGLHDPNGSVLHNTICNNTASGNGGGISVGSGTFSNNVISNNTAVSGGGIYCLGNGPDVLNCTISNNSSANGGALFCEISSNPTLRNCILWGNTARIAGPAVYLKDQPSCDATNFYFCDVLGGTSAFGLNGNFFTGKDSAGITSDPLFVSPSAGSGTGFNGLSANWSLQAASPCINMGDPATNAPATDIAGNTRVSGGRVDMGAYEYIGPWGISSLTANCFQLNLFPQPAVNDVWLDVGSYQNEIGIELINAVGESVMVDTYRNAEFAFLNLQNLPSGVYFILVHTEKGRATKKLIKL